MTRRVLAAITLDEAGGGVAAVSRLLWRVFREEWNGDARLLSLIDPTAGPRLDVTLVAKQQFGVRLVGSEIRKCRWVFYAHLSLALAQRYVPPPFRRPYGVFLHGIEAWRSLTAPQTHALRQASVLVANSEYTARRIAEAHPWVGPITVCPLALPETVADEIPASDTNTIIVVGRLDSSERYKGHDQLIEIWPTVRARVPDARLDVVGDGDDRDRLRAKAQAHGLDEAVTFHGFVEAATLDRLYRQAAAFAMPSRNEGFGLVYLEAMRRGLPCIGSIHDAAADVIVDGQTGFLVDQSDGPALADRIVRLLTDRALRTRLGTAGRERLATHFHYAAFRRRFVSLVHEHLDGDAIRPPLVAQAGQR